MTIIGVVGWLLLVLTVLLDLGMGIRAGRLVTPAPSALLDLEWIVLVPFTLTIVTIVYACRREIGRYARTLEQRSEEIANWDVRRGFKLDLEGLPRELRSYGAAINDLVARLEDVALKRELFAVQVAHELKNPMAILLLELERLDTRQSRRLIDDVRAMDRLLNQLLLLARLQAHATMSELEQPVDLAELAAEAVAAAAPRAAAEKRSLRFENDEAEATLGQRELIGAAVRNLIENATRVTPELGEIIVTAGPGATITVKDGGPGVSGRDLRKLVRPFVQSSGASRSGAGLGLAIVHETARLHKGRLTTATADREMILTFPQYQPGTHKGEASVRHSSATNVNHS